MRKLSLVIAGILGAGSPLISQAATLGQAEVQSYLSEPLEVRVPLMRSSNEPLDEITVQLAPPSFYREAGVPLVNLTGNLTFAIESERGQDYVLIGSKRPIRDPIMSLLLQVQSPQGRMIRSYNLLLDPPTMASSSPEPEQPIAGSETNRTASAPPAARDWQRVEPARDLTLDSTRTVERGDTLSEIASDYVGEGEDVRSMMQAIIDANPHAFANGNGNALLAGAQLKVPTRDGEADADATPEEGLGEESRVEADSAQQLPALELLGPDTEQGAGSAELGKLSRDNPLPALSGAPTAAEPMGRDDALAQEELESVKAENQALTDQLRALKQEIDSVQIAVDERDATIAELEDTVAESRQQVQEAKARQNDFWTQWGKYLAGGMGLLIIALLIALALRRSRQDEPAVPMPATADTGQEPRVTHPVTEADSPVVGPAGAVAGGVAVGTAGHEGQDETTSQDREGAGQSSDDPMNPEMALEEARVLESFNLTHQAIELLQDSLAEHPGHTGLQSAISRLSGLEQAGEGGSTESFDAPSADTSETSEEASPEEGAQADELPEEAQDQEPAAAHSPGEISWDDDFEDMLATPDTPRESTADENMMEFDDSFALETPAQEPVETDGESVGASPHMDEVSLELSENEEPAASVQAAPETTAEASEELDVELTEPPTADEPTDVDNGEDASRLDVSSEPAEESTSAEPANQAADTQAESDAEDVDTRVSLAEAFLDVGDRESFEMIEAELREEGATSALQRLDELKRRYEG